MNAYRLLFGDLIARLGWRFPVLVVMMVLVGVSEGASVALLLPLLSRIGVVSAGNQGMATAILEKGLSLVGASDTLDILAVIIVFAIVQMALYVSLHWWNAKLARSYQGQRQSELFRALVRARWSFIVDRKVGDLTSAIVTESHRLGGAVMIALSIVSTTVLVVIYFGLSLLVSWQITLSLIALALAGGLALARLYRNSYAAGRRLPALNAELQSTLGEQLAGIKLVKATASEDRAVARVDPLLRRVERANAFVSFMPALVRGILECMALIGLSVMFVLGNQWMGVALSNVVVVLALFARLFPRITTLQAQLHNLNGYVHAIEAINSLQSTAEAETERQDRSIGALKVDLPTRLVVQNLEVSFGQRKVLDRVGMTLPIPGMTALVGGSGAGKSTIVHALLALIEPSAGTIRLGSHDLASVPIGAWRRAIGYVPQETILFHASIRENLTLANPAASDAEVKAAARRAHADEFIAALPEGYDTVIGDQGGKLSGGQRQRLGIARALLMNPILLVMDEAMSALDNESELELMSTLEELRKQMGILIIAHRLAAVRSADSICVIEAGRVVETGNWNELMARRARLYSLVEAQSLFPERSAVAL